MPFILVSVVNRDISLTKHISYASAYEKMKKELLEFLRSEYPDMDMVQLDKIRTSYKSESYGFNLENFSAWATLDDGFMECNWSIYEMSKVQKG